MLLENDSVFTKLQADLNPGLLRLMTFTWACQAEHAILEALATADEAITTRACCLVTHGKLVYQSLCFLESVALDISSLLATEVATVKQEKEEITSKLSTAFSMRHGALHILEG